MNKSIVFVISAMARGGAERVISILANNYAKKGWDVSIIMLWHNTVGYELDEKIKIIDFSNDKKKPILRIPSLIRRLKKYAKKNKPSAVVSFIAENAIISHFALKRLGVRSIVSERNDPSVVKNPLVKWMTKRVYAKSSVTVFQTERIKNYFPENVRKNSVIIPNPIAVKAVGTSEKVNEIVTAGRLESQKNQKMLINAFKTVHDLHPEYVLTIYGEGRLRGELEAQVEELGLKDAVSLPGNVENLHERTAKSKAFVLSSDYEGLSNALLEAMMMGLCSISTNCAGSDEAITDGENGLLVPVGDQQALEKAMLKVIEDDNLRENLEKNALLSSEKYKTENVIKLWEEVIEQGE